MPVMANDLNVYNPADNSWTALDPLGAAPLARKRMGFAAAPDGLLYAFGGMGENGGERHLYRQLTEPGRGRDRVGGAWCIR